MVLYGGNNNWFAAYAYWYFKLYGHENVKLIDGGRKKWELDGRPLSKDAVERPATQYQAKEPDLSIRAFRDEVVASIGSKNLIDVRSPDEFSGKILAPAHLPQEQAQKGRPRPDREEHPVEQGGQRGRHVQERRAARRALRRAGLRRRARRPSPTAASASARATPGSCCASCSASPTSRTTTAAGSSTARSSASRSRSELTMCGAPKQGGALAGIDLSTQTVIQGQVWHDGAPVAGAYVRLLDATDEFTAEVVDQPRG